MLDYSTLLLNTNQYLEVNIMKKTDKSIKKALVDNMNFYAQTNFEFDENLKNLDISVPHRGNTRLTEHSESWQIHRLLTALKSKEFIKLPFELIKRERPDFIIKSGGKIFGVELMEAINSDYARIKALQAKLCDNSTIDTSHFKWKNAKLSLDQLRAILNDDHLTGPVWSGNSVEKEFSQSIYDCLNLKHNLLKNGYERFDDDYLLIYHNTPSPLLNFNIAVNLTEDLLKSYWSKDGFDMVFILKNNHLISLSIERTMYNRIHHQ